MVALLIAMAQKQYKALKAAKHKTPIDEEKPANFYVSEYTHHCTAPPSRNSRSYLTIASL
jgi:hypothetical protein